MEKLVFSSAFDEKETYYARTTSKEAQKLEKEILSLYGISSDTSIDLTPSGMAAISSLFHNFALSAVTRASKQEKGLSIILDQEVYSDTPNLLKFIQTLHAPYITLNRADCADLGALRAVIKSEHDANPHRRIVVFAESCSNPSGRIFIFDHVKKLKEEFGSTLWFVIDNTWTTALGVNPFTYDVDVVVESLTKYMGAGRAIGGVILSKHGALMADVRQWHRINGLHVSISNATEILSGIQDIRERMKNSSAAAMTVMTSLVQKGIDVIHPFIANHPSKDLNEKLGLIKFAPAVFLIKSALTNKEDLKAKVTQTGVLEWKTSYGGPLCRVDSYPTFKKKEGYSLIRIAIGFEPFDEQAVVSALLKIVSSSNK